MRRASEALLLLALVAGARAQGFGRFGYTDRPLLPDLNLAPDGIGPVKFDTPASAWKVVVADETGVTIGLGQTERGPSKARLSLLAPGLSLWFPKGMRLRVESIGAPYLTWPEGSVRNGVPTPAVSWLAFSFAESRPPLILGFPDGRTALRIEGKPGAWTLEAPPDFHGWLRVASPLGSKAILANTSADLGRLAQQAAAFAGLVTGKIPQLVSTSVEADALGVEATWKFDAPNSLVPSAALLAGLGGYGLRIDSKTTKLDAPTSEGPVAYTPGTELKIRFPVRRIPTGRAVGVGGTPHPIGTVSPFDAPSVAELAFENLLATADPEARKTAEAASAEWIGQVPVVAEPNTGQTLLYGAHGEGIDLAAAHALLAQSLVTSRRATSEANSLLTSLTWRRDWSTWRLWVPDEGLARRAGAFAALAAAICPEPERRLDAAMFEAGLAAQIGLDIWRRRRGEIAAEPVRPDPFASLRGGLFRNGNDPFVRLLRSPLRVYGDPPVTAKAMGDSLALDWPVIEVKGGVLTLASGYPIRVAANGTYSQFHLTQALGFSEVRYVPETAGTCEILVSPFVSVPPWCPPPSP
ncbi:hypothetical protein BH11ARM2_BH11ARM2_02780 [soil metagenome]